VILTSDSEESSAIYLLDTHAAYWLAIGSSRLSQDAKAAMSADNATLAMSAVTAFEYADLVQRLRLPLAPPLPELLSELAIDLLDYPAAAARLAPLLPLIHLDPVDRMLIAHAVVAEVTLITADEDMRSYPVQWIW
jgi:PIN domain nuclease of toxin-antitoxin system